MQLTGYVPSVGIRRISKTGVLMTKKGGSCAGFGGMRGAQAPSRCGQICGWVRSTHYLYQARSASASSAWSFLTLLQNNLLALNTRVLFDTNAPKYLRALSRHADEDVRNMAISLHTAIHANWMEAQANKRRRLK